MNLLKLNDDFELAVERHEKQARLVIYKQGVENICRKESFNKLKHFIELAEGHAFKGRLQLHKTKGGIVVQVKGDVVGEISATAFLNLLGL